MSITKPIYKMTIDLTTFRSDGLKATLDRIRDLVADQDKTMASELKTKITIEGDNLAGLQAIRNQLEIYLRHNQNTIVSGTVDIKEPLIRPKAEPTPMDRMLDGLVGDGVEAVTLSHGDKSVTITSDTARNASAMLRDDDGWGAVSSDHEPWEA